MASVRCLLRLGGRISAGKSETRLMSQLLLIVEMALLVLMIWLWDWLRIGSRLSEKLMVDLNS